MLKMWKIVWTIFIYTFLSNSFLILADYESSWASYFEEPCCSSNSNRLKAKGNLSQLNSLKNLKALNTIYILKPFFGKFIFYGKT
jgi:hypothetical protein